MSDKIGERHLARRAILYVRQSSAQQLANNEESRRLQYAMRERLQTLGWREVEVIDEDLGKSAAGSVDRSGFRRLVAEVSLGLVAGVPIGYRVTDDGRLEKTPDARVRQMVELIFAKFFELGSARQVMLWLVASGMQVAVTRDRRGTVEWKAPTADDVSRMLTNPAYAGAYAYGRTTQRLRVVDGQLRSSSGRVRRSEWPVLLHDRHEAYISWQQFERVEEMLAKNAQARGGQGAARRGHALLAGLVFCQRCGCRMGVSYSGKSPYGRYRCDAANTRHGAPKCISFSALDVDEEVARQVIAVVQPGAIEAARVAWEHDAAAGDRTLETLELQAEQARFEASRAERQYNAVDPDNRTVARELERRWNAALEVISSLEQRVVDARATQTRATATAPDLEEYLSLSRDLERVWSADTTDATLKKRIVRAVIEQVWTDIDDVRREIVLIVHWKGGAHAELRVRKRYLGEHGDKTAPDVVEAVRALARIMPDQQIALWLGRAGMRTPSGAHYTRALVASVRHLRGIEAYTQDRQRDGDWLTCEQAAKLLRVHGKTVRRAAAGNELPALRPLPNGPWIFAHHDIVAATAARHVAVRTDRRRRIRGVGRSSDQLMLEIPNT